jgi:hypothetical protein
MGFFGVALIKAPSEPACLTNILTEYSIHAYMLVFKITGIHSNCRSFPGMVSILHSGVLEEYVKENRAILTGSFDSAGRL